MHNHVYMTTDAFIVELYWQHVENNLNLLFASRYDGGCQPALVYTFNGRCAQPTKLNQFRVHCLIVEHTHG